MNLSDELIEKIAIKSIKNYLNNDNFNDDYIKANFEEAILLAKEEMRELKTKSVGVTSETQGQRSKSYAQNIGVGNLSDNVKSLLPMPYIKLF